MGGNIKFLTPTRRYNKEEYVILRDELIHELFTNIFTDSSLTCKISDLVQEIQSIKSKDSFGDMDIVVSSEYLLPNYIDIIIQIFNLDKDDILKNGDVLSIAYKNFQIDLIITKPENYRSSLNYFAYNDFSMIIGKIFRAYFGVRFGHRGLDISIQNDYNKIGEIFLTKDIKKIHELLKLNHNTWLSGFDTFEDMFEYITTTPYFNKNIFSYENMNSTDRIRERKRKTYELFLDYINSKDNLTECKYENISLKDGYSIKEPQFTDIICKEFHHVKNEYDKIITDYEENKLFKTKFNGEICLELLGLEGKELGQFMQWARDEIKRTNTKNLFLRYDNHTCSLMIQSMYNCYNLNWNWLCVPKDEATNFVRNS